MYSKNELDHRQLIPMLLLGYFRVRLQYETISIGPQQCRGFLACDGFSVVAMFLDAVMGRDSSSSSQLASSLASS